MYMYILIGKDSELETFKKNCAFYTIWQSYVGSKKKNLNVCSTDSKVIIPDIF